MPFFFPIKDDDKVNDNDVEIGGELSGESSDKGNDKDVEIGGELSGESSDKGEEAVESIDEKEASRAGDEVVAKDDVESNEKEVREHSTQIGSFLKEAGGKESPV